MPNEFNIEAPISLFGFGRSGTSLIMDIFKRHGDVDVLGETGGLIFGAGRCLRDGLRHMRERYNLPLTLSEPSARVRRIIKTILLDEFRSGSTHWFHKPIGIDVYTNWFSREKGAEIAAVASDYWEFMQLLFPHSRNIFIFRNPSDVLISSKRYGGYNVEPVSHMLLLHTRLMLWGLNNSFSIKFEELIESREIVLNALLEAVGVDGGATCATAFDRVHVPVPGRAITGQKERRKTVQEFSYVEFYEELASNEIVTKNIAEIKRLLSSININY